MARRILHELEGSPRGDASRSGLGASSKPSRSQSVSHADFSRFRVRDLSFGFHPGATDPITSKTCAPSYGCPPPPPPCADPCTGLPCSGDPCTGGPCTHGCTQPTGISVWICDEVDPRARIVDPLESQLVQLQMLVDARRKLRNR